MKVPILTIQYILSQCQILTNFPFTNSTCYSK
ncbi:hypothetical protein BDL97_08G131600 [Sphagnum fallax]|nr:hypothetical protein BDL97_08G131600 [Sphagnum fallax]